MAFLSSVDGCGIPEECNICYESYQEVSTRRVPKLLWCFHTICLACLRKLVCQSKVVSFVVCPFCRMVTLVPQGGLQALRNNEALLREIGPPRAEVSQATSEDGLEEDKDSTRGSNWSFGDVALSLEYTYRPTSSIFTVSNTVPAFPMGFHAGIWSGLHLQEMQNAVVIEMPPRAFSAPASVENLRICIAVTLILLVVSIFFMLVFS
ncbi:RING finger protein 208-like [Ahaetulla prasina]|uniref:RING finger protein 208-like n=1 Tax=Ahaetulla prasina TaxID=499056 RepID=UPI002648D2D9|nr:RING finger protein 208-like [Ahaetulla prasina]